MQVVILAGGLGTRISSISSDVPKPMIEICGKPVLERQIVCLREQGLTNITLLIGHLGSVVRDYFGDGTRFGVSVKYIEEKEPMGTAGALYFLKGSLFDSFLLLNGDLAFDIDFSRMLHRHRETGALATILTHPNDHPFDSALIFADSNGRVLRWMHKEEARSDYRNKVNAGIHILEPSVLDVITKPVKADLDRDLLKPLLKQGGLFAYDSPEYVKDMGTPQRLRTVCDDFSSGLVHAKNLSKPQRAVFLDRDGTINKYKDFITHPDQIELLPGAAEAVRKINRSGRLAIIITNQPVIARGECTFTELEAIHFRLERLLGEQGAYVDDIFVCPHHPDKGFPGERSEFKLNCDCRKPKPGLFFKARDRYNINLSDSWMIGDSQSDMEAGKSAGCRTALVGAGHGSVGSLLNAVNMIEEEEYSCGSNIENFGY